MSKLSADPLSKSVQKVRDWLWMFPSSSSSNSLTSWWLNCSPEPVLIDCPDLSPEVISDLRKLSIGLQPKIILTNRDSHGKVSQLHKEFGWQVLLHEQESYLLPGIEKLETFSEEAITSSGLKLLWTPGATPGSCVVYAPAPWNVLFCGRLLIPVATDQLGLIRSKRTFHWSIQKKSFKKLCQWIRSDQLPLLASGGSVHLLGDEKILPWGAVQTLRN
ncbi:MBL fold metallo-hydrolase [Prochlorococcus marinus]|uniref:MBL fold metallo-hydrolase n=1 Tax=Prochlorococcus marinus TaxID=1219 RepID=UPI0022B4EBDD|nr:MBL fold metallo-hydrolase [Prochlorococcus marinus]